MTPANRAHRLVNATTRPVELLLSSGAVVIPAGGETACDDDDLRQGQVSALCDSGVLVAHRVPAKKPPPSDPSAPRRRKRATIPRPAGSAKTPVRKRPSTEGEAPS